MVNGIFTIPLPGKNWSASGDLSAPAHPLAEFVAGPENSLAAHALRPYLDRTASHYSPLLLYGPHGSGKSHLAQGLAQWWRQHYPEQLVACLNAAEFAQDYAAALKDHRLDAWRRQMRQLDLLVVEDLGQFSGKRTAQQELLHTLDALAQREALVVLTSRSLPTHTPILLCALRSRLSAGLAVPLALPGTGTRRAILERLAAAEGISLPKRAMHRLADGLSLSVPALASALLELEFKSRHDGQDVDHVQVGQYVAENSSAKMPTLREIGCQTAKYFGLKLSELKSPQRRQPLVAARGVAMYLARHTTDKTLEQIGGFFGGRDHTTVMHGCRRTEKLLKRDRGTRQAVSELKKLLIP